MEQFGKTKLIDCHVHTYDMGCLDSIGQEMEKYGLDAINILSLTSYGEEHMAQNPLCLLFKLKYPGRVYSYGALHYPLNGIDREHADFRDQAANLMRLGFDGIKMIEGKPDIRKRINTPLDSEIYDEFFSYLETEQIPLLYHVADPASFWDACKVPAFAIKENWFYGDGTFVSKSTLYNEIDSILKKFPKLRVIFAHFYFMSENIDLASEFLDQWPGVSYDITPGTEMYGDFSNAPDRWHDFFTKYRNRILLGTDNVCGDQFEMIRTLRRFLETDDEFQSFNMELKGLHLDKEVLQNIYCKNFQRYSGAKPKEVDYDKAIEECYKVIDRCKSSPLAAATLPRISEILNKLYRTGKGSAFSCFDFLDSTCD